MQASSDIFLFADFRFDRCGGGLFRRDDRGAFAPVAMGSRALDLLAVLIERRGDVVSKEEIMAAVWPRMAVEEGNLFVQIKALRAILDKEQSGQSCIQTIAGRGYRFVAPVTRCAEGMDSPTPPPPTEQSESFKHEDVKPSVPLAKARSPELQRPVSAVGYEFAPAVREAEATLSARPPKVADPAPATDQRRTAVHASLPVLALPDKPSLAVLPFQNMSGDPEQEYFADGMVEDIVTGLARIKWLFVIARNSSAVYKGRAVDVRQAGRELGVRYLLEGGVRKSGGRLRITAQLVEAESGAHLWADKFDGGLEDVFDLQDRITERVVGIVEPSVQKSEIERSRRKRPESLDAYDLYLRALPFVRSLDPESASIAAGLLSDALKAYPSFALAHAYLALSHQIRFTRADFAEAEKAAAIRHARAAIANEVDDATALAVGAYVIGLVGNDAPSALDAIERALSYNPSSAAAHFFGAFLYAWSGGPVRGTDLAKRALRLSPFDPLTYQAHLAFGVATLHQGRYEEAASWWERCPRANPKFGAFAAAHAHTLALAGRMEEAKAIYAKALELEPSLCNSALRSLGYAPEIETLWLRASRLLGVPESIAEPAPNDVDRANQNESQTTLLPVAGKNSAGPALSIVVLPFDNIGGDAEQDYFVDGVTDSLTTDLSRIRNSFVIARNTAFAYKGRPMDVRAIGRELNVRYVLEGSVQRSGDRMRVSAQLIDAESGVHLWAERFDESVADLFDLQDTVVGRIANMLSLQIEKAEAGRAERRPTPDSMDLYFQGVAWLHRGVTRENVARARPFLERALALDPSNVHALVNNSIACAVSAISSFSDEHIGLLACAEASAAKALLLAPDYMGAHFAMGFVLNLTNRAAKGAAACERALALNRNFVAAHGVLGSCKICLGRSEEAEAHVREALRLSPRDQDEFMWTHIAGVAALHLGRHEAAELWLNRSIAANPAYPPAYPCLAAALAHLGRAKEATSAIETALALDPQFSVRRFRERARSDNAVYLEQRERIVDGLRKASAPEA